MLGGVWLWFIAFVKYSITASLTLISPIANIPLQMRDKDIFHLSAATSFVELNTQADTYIGTKWLHHPCLDWYFINKYLFDAGGIVANTYGYELLPYKEAFSFSGDSSKVQKIAFGMMYRLMLKSSDDFAKFNESHVVENIVAAHAFQAIGVVIVAFFVYHYLSFAIAVLIVAVFLLSIYLNYRKCCGITNKLQSTVEGMRRNFAAMESALEKANVPKFALTEISDAINTAGTHGYKYPAQLYTILDLARIEGRHDIYNCFASTRAR